MNDDAAADPDHRRGAGDAEKGQEAGHAEHQRAAERAAESAHHRRTLVAGERDAGVVGFHDQRDHAIDRDRDADADQRQYQRLGPDGGVGHRRERDRHDLGRKDEVGLDRAGDLLVLERLRRQRHAAELGLVGMRLMRDHDLEDFLHALVTKIGAAEHQQRRDRPGHEVAEDQRGRQQDQQLVAERPPRDLGDDRQLALGGEPDHVTRRDRGVVDDHAGRLYARLGGLAGDVVQRCRRHAGERRNSVCPDTPSPLPAIPKTSLYKPNGAGPFPALVLHHQCGGLARGKWQNKSILEWVKQGVNRGYVVLLIDSLGPRNVETLCMGAKNGVNLARGARDALQGAEHLRKFDFVDKKRIAHAGYSWGGMLGLLANTKAYQFALRLDGFGAHVSFYPGCFMIPATAPFEIVRPDIIRPHLILMAEKDNETPADECVRKLSDVKGKGAPVEWHVYLGATHCWDCENLNNVSKVDNRGNRVTYKYDAKATADSAKRMFEFLDRTWRASGS